MPLHVTHEFRSSIPDDSIALANGEICPQSHWNAEHSVEGTLERHNMAHLPAMTILGNPTNGSAAPQVLTMQQLLAMLGGHIPGPDPDTNTWDETGPTAIVWDSGAPGDVWL